MNSRSSPACPHPTPTLCDLNDVVVNGMSVFEGRLEGIDLRIDLAPSLPPVLVDPSSSGAWW